MAKETRKCGTCGKPITIGRQNIDNIVLYSNRYHHIDCLVCRAEEGVASKKHVVHWETVLKNIPEYQAAAKKQLAHSSNRDVLNDYILKHYNLVTISRSFWSTIEEIGNGNYRGKKCRPTDIDTIYGAWEWSQKNLNAISEYNKRNNIGPQGTEQRLRYDLAIVMSKIPQYLSYVEKSNSNIQEARKNVSFDEINVSKLGQKKVEKKEDVSDIFDDFFS